ncbi:MaoC family dehydratase N-terminal domain-containing protein [Glycomyces sp. L485]|uniref:FAS1-like dehydratase domain-containing protein n=1 Tax=Glycomyces sp. L485 TaxID=2909235 RepID=UPI001F4BBDE3|nr:MaoC family dehydratase N-terminal domain-containing protein [Glycomyces sp. L485]MCH7230633.1 MaoC family dehydratase N-terminal domain-containing protein [Glycomyces sp. L485]
MPTTEPVVITADSVSRFARALGLPGDAAVPPTYLVSLTMPAADPLIADPEFGLDWSRVLHRDQRFVYHRELRAGTEVALTPTVESIKTVAGNDLLTIHTEVADAEGLAAEVWTTLFVAGDPA